MFSLYKDVEPGTASHFRRAEPEMVREIWSESLAVPVMPPGSEAGGSF